jgi:uncharacterized membrane protein YhaH (DUF805 family)
VQNSYLSGRAGRKEYWLTVVTVVVVSIGLRLMHVNAGALEGVLAIAQVRRLHDFNRSGWWAALGHGVPAAAAVSVLAVGGHTQAAHALALGAALVLGLIFMVWVGSIPGDAEDNRFGARLLWRTQAAPAG